MSESKSATSKLFSPLELFPGITIPNRIIVAPMCQYSATNGIPNDWHFVHVGSLATHGCSTIVVEATGVTPNGRITPGCTGLWSEEHTAAHKKIVDFVEKHTKSLIGIQLGHAGRKASSQLPFIPKPMNHTLLADEKDGGWPDNVVAPSAIPWDDKSAKPKALTEEQIQDYVKEFGNAAVRAKDAGYKFIMIHGAHGYLIHEFLSPITNKRTDKYGGSFENRTRFLSEIIVEIRARLGEKFPLAVRFSCSDWIDGEESWTPEQTAELALKLSEAPYNVKWVDCSSGGVDVKQRFPKPIPLGYQTQFAKIVKDKVGSKATVTAVGLVVDPQQCEDILADTGVDGVSLARQLLREPSFTFRAAHELGGVAEYPLPYGYACSNPAPVYEKKK